MPQFILEDADAAGYGSTVSIVCTQPRRIAAVSVAERVAYERGGNGSGDGAVGGTVGYAIRGESRYSPTTRLLFCTTGVLLRRLATDPSLSGVSHVVIDEIHERGLNEDFLLICIKDLLRFRQGLRVILMSATIQADQFARYFGDNTPVVEIPGVTYPVREIWLEDLLQSTGYFIPPPSVSSHRGKGGKDHGRSGVGRFTVGDMQAAEAAESDVGRRVAASLSNWTSEHHLIELVSLALTFVTHRPSEQSAGDVKSTNRAVLVFLNGLDDIRAMKEHLEAPGHPLSDKSQFLILPLHSALPAASHRAVFVRPPAGVVKVHTLVHLEVLCNAVQVRVTSKCVPSAGNTCDQHRGDVDHG